MRMARLTDPAARFPAFICSRQSRAATNSSPASAVTPTQSAFRCRRPGCRSCVNACSPMLPSHLTSESLDQALLCDADLPLDQITPELYAALQRLQPHGMDNEEPLFIARNVLVAGEVRVLKERHIKLHCRAAEGTQRLPRSAGGGPTASPRWSHRGLALGYCLPASPQRASRVRRRRAGDRRPSALLSVANP